MKRMVSSRSLLAVVGVSLAALACAPPLQGDFGGGKVNEWFPIKVGASWTYQGLDEGAFTTEVVTVTPETMTITDNGKTVQANVVTDNVYKSCAGATPSLCFYLAEHTNDFYATANDGTVWYLGEDTAELNRAGQVTTTEGSWQAGVNGAHGGIFMPANPAVGQSFQQENAVDAKDFFAIEWLLFDTMVTREWSPLEPGVVEHKSYHRGVGLEHDGGLSLVTATGL